MLESCVLDKIYPIIFIYNAPKSNENDTNDGNLYD